VRNLTVRNHAGERKIKVLNQIKLRSKEKETINVKSKEGKRGKTGRLYREKEIYHKHLRGLQRESRVWAPNVEGEQFKGINE
jgi:hypothetical protein